MGSEFLRTHPGQGLTLQSWRQQSEHAISQMAKHGEAWTRSQWMSMADAEKRGTTVRRMAQDWMRKYGRSLDKVNTAVASLPARPVTPTPSGYDRIRARLKAVERQGSSRVARNGKGRPALFT